MEQQKMSGIQDNNAGRGILDNHAAADSRLEVECSGQGVRLDSLVLPPYLRVDTREFGEVFRNYNDLSIPVAALPGYRSSVCTSNETPASIPRGSAQPDNVRQLPFLRRLLYGGVAAALIALSALGAPSESSAVGGVGGTPAPAYSQSPRPSATPSPSPSATPTPAPSPSPSLSGTPRPGQPNTASLEEKVSQLSPSPQGSPRGPYASQPYASQSVTDTVPLITLPIKKSQWFMIINLWTKWQEAVIYTGVDCSGLTQPTPTPTPGCAHSQAKSHNGIDYYVPEGTEIIAAADGIVSRLLGPDDCNEMDLYINHPGYDLTTIYDHLKSVVPWLKVGDSVTRGSVVGYSNGPGSCAGYHLHFGFKDNILVANDDIYPYRDTYKRTDTPGSVSYWANARNEVNCPVHYEDLNNPTAPCVGWDYDPATPTPTFTATPVPSFTPTATPSVTQSPIIIPTFTPTPTPSPSVTQSPIIIPTFTPTPTIILVVRPRLYLPVITYQARLDGW